MKVYKREKFHRAKDRHERSPIEKHREGNRVVIDLTHSNKHETVQHEQIPNVE